MDMPFQKDQMSLILSKTKNRKKLLEEINMFKKEEKIQMVIEIEQKPLFVM